jgi:hypothetical protein
LERAFSSDIIQQLLIIIQAIAMCTYSPQCRLQMGGRGEEEEKVSVMQQNMHAPSISNFAHLPDTTMLKTQ